MSIRTDLQKHNRKRMRFEGKVTTFSRKSKYHGSPKTILVKDIKLFKNKEPVAKHVWFTAGQWSRSLRKGDHITFDARVQVYEKNYKGKKNSKFNYKLVYPSNIKTNVRSHNA